MKMPGPARRKYDDSEPAALATYAHDRLDRIEPKLDKLIRNNAIGYGVLAALYILLQFPQLQHTIEPAQAQEIPHAGQKFERPASRH